ncbi:YlbF family regulator [Bacillus niameyensis]|uniref:YlbF family regulator n=1 Tax=Bacillus niameyensis TaxID=1522308 RepID=UPI0007867BBA|nr:YlbF family regulator [Bacillus niameyensis]
MMIKLDRDFVSEKMEGFCSELLEQEDFQALREMIENFAADQSAQDQYNQFVDQYEAYQQKDQEMGLTEEEVAALEQAEMNLYESTVIREYLFAQREFSTIHDLISQYYQKTVELNRLPLPRELKKEGCGCGGACGGH